MDASQTQTCLFYTFLLSDSDQFKLTFMGTLQVRTKWNYRSWIQIFQIKFLFLVLSLWKRIALVYFLKTDWSYTFLKVKNSNPNFNWKKKFWNAWNLNFHGVKMAVMHFVTHITHVTRHFGVYCRKQNQKFRENCFKNVVSDVNKNWFKSPQNYF